MEMLIVVIVLAVVAIAIFVIKYVFIGAVFLFAWASAEKGFWGATVYFLCWVFLFPFVVIACAIAGVVVSWSNIETS